MSIYRDRTIDSKFYTSTTLYEESREKIFSPSWQLIADSSDLEENGTALPIDLLPGMLDESLLLTRSGVQVHGCSNVCTHRGMLVVPEKLSGVKTLRCPYHGRCFRLDGRFKSMPEFARAEDFPQATDSLASIRIESWGPFYFTQLEAGIPFSEWIHPMQDRMSFIDWSTLRRRSEYDLRFQVQAHWALDIDNYLEGLHIPYVHEGLHKALEMEDYASEIFNYSNLQLGIGRDQSEHIPLPIHHPQSSQSVHAFYFWLWPNMMFNFYSWGVSVNIIQPTAVDCTEVLFQTWLREDIDRWDNQGLRTTELEDEAIVEAVQRGVRSRYYKAGRYSPTMERGVYHFHQLLQRALA